MQNSSSSPHLTLLLAQFPGQFKLTLRQAANALGIAEQTARNRVTNRSFPLPTFKEGKLRLVALVDLAAYLDSTSAAAACPAAAPPAPPEPMRKRGRPRNVVREVNHAA